MVFHWRQQVSSNLRSQQCSSLDGLHSSSNFQALQSLYQSECTSYNWYHRHFHIPQFVFFFNSLARSSYLSHFSLSSSFTQWSAGRQSPLYGRFSSLSFFCRLSQGLVVWPRLDDSFVSQNPKEFCAFHFLGRILGCGYTICSYGQITISCTIPSLSPSPYSRVLYSFCANLLHSLIIIIISSSYLEPHNYANKSLLSNRNNYLKPSK